MKNSGLYLIAFVTLALAGCHDKAASIVPAAPSSQTGPTVLVCTITPTPRLTSLTSEAPTVTLTLSVAARLDIYTIERDGRENPLLAIAFPGGSVKQPMPNLPVALKVRVYATALGCGRSLPLDFTLPASNPTGPGDVAPVSEPTSPPCVNPKATRKGCDW